MKADAQSLKRWLGMALFILSFAFYGFLLLVPFTPFSAEGKIAFSAAVVVLARELFLALGHPSRPRGDSKVSKSRLAIPAFWIAEKNLNQTRQRGG